MKEALVIVCWYSPLSLYSDSVSLKFSSLSAAPLKNVACILWVTVTCKVEGGLVHRKL